MFERIVCPVWDSNDKRFQSRHYQAWDRRCGFCDRTIVVSNANKEKLDSTSETVLICEQCDLVRAQSEIEAIQKHEATALEAMEPCAICAELRAQEQEAAKELATCESLPDSPATKTARRKWSHLFNSWLTHQFKAHSSAVRGRV
jgi:hypothetical protein